MTKPRIDRGILNLAIHLLNGSGLAKYEIVRVSIIEKWNEAVNRFLDCCETVPQNLENELPELVKCAYNELANPGENTGFDFQGAKKEHEAINQIKTTEACEPEEVELKHGNAAEPSLTLKQVKTAEPKAELTQRPPVNPIEGDPFEKLISRILKKDDFHMTHVVDKLLVQGATLDQIHKRVAEVAQKMGRISMLHLNDVKFHIKWRRKCGWVFSEANGKIQLIGAYVKDKNTPKYSSSGTHEYYQIVDEGKVIHYEGFSHPEALKVGDLLDSKGIKWELRKSYK